MGNDDRPKFDVESAQDPVYRPDAAQLMQDPVYRAEHDLRKLDDEGVGEERYRVLERVYPLMRGRGMHYVRRFRRTCELANTGGEAAIHMHIFQGCAAHMGLR